MNKAHNKAVLRKNGVKVLSATEKISEDSTGILLESLLEGYAEFYSADLSEKVIRGLTENALKCKYNGGGIPIGYKIDDEQHFQIDPLTAPIVLDAFKMYSDGGTIKSVMDFLNGKGITTYVGKPLRIDAVKRLLKNRRYIGEYKYRDVVTPNGVPAIVPVDLFERVGERMDKNKKAPASAKAKEEFYLLTTKLFCGKCGAFMVGESGTGRSQIYRYYKCVNTKKRKTCDKKPVKKDLIENLVVSETMRMIMDDKAIEAIVSMVMDIQTRENTALPLFEQQLQEANNGIQNVLNAIQQGILTKSTKTRLEELEAVKEDLEIKIANENITKPKLTAEFVTFWLHKFRKLDIKQKSHRQILIDNFINSIYLYDDRIIFIFNYKTEAQIINLSDLECSDLGECGAPREEARHEPCFFSFSISDLSQTKQATGGCLRHTVDSRLTLLHQSLLVGG